MSLFHRSSTVEDHPCGWVPEETSRGSRKTTIECMIGVILNVSFSGQRELLRIDNRIKELRRKELACRRTTVNDYLIVPFSLEQTRYVSVRLEERTKRQFGNLLRHYKGLRRIDSHRTKYSIRSLILSSDRPRTLVIYTDTTGFDRC